ncbi:MAG TPA: NAD(P)/FAD-dependent oxidoreductase [Burkholderiaceae bacterium]|nr:NAD(P)/FAD-dependent oxidoreductase [Burkholderiaceae bacterium]
MLEFIKSADAPPRASRPVAARGYTTHRIVVVGGGAGGLELATRLGDHFSKTRSAHVVLVDRVATHLWKPLLHEVAAGSMDTSANQLEYAAQARWHHFEFQQGALIGLDRTRKAITVAALRDEDGLEILPQREIPYDTLVLAIGSVTNFFNTPGAAEHAMAVDTVSQAEHFRRRLIAVCMRTQNQLGTMHGECHPRVHVAIVGGGATGVELSAELRNTAQVLGAYGLHDLDPKRDIRITILEAGPRILPPLPEYAAQETTRTLERLNVGILTGERVTEVREHAVLTASGVVVPADLTVWAAGIQVSKVLADFGLPVNRLGQVQVTPTLQTEIDPDIFAFGDCASCPWPENGTTVPPRAQAAHQQAKHLYRALQHRLAGKPLPRFDYQDFGSLVSLGGFNAIGSLVDKATGKPLLVEGTLARLIYASLYRAHVMALHGLSRTILDTLAHWLRRGTTPRVKLH